MRNGNFYFTYSMKDHSKIVVWLEAGQFLNSKTTPMTILLLACIADKQEFTQKLFYGQQYKQATRWKIDFSVRIFRLSDKTACSPIACVGKYDSVCLELFGKSF